MSTRLAPPGRPRRTRDERVVRLRSSMPLRLVTLRHEIPKIPQHESMTTPKVVVEPVQPSPAAEPAADDETPAGKGGDARW